MGMENDFLGGVEVDTERFGLLNNCCFYILTPRDNDNMRVSTSVANFYMGKWLDCLGVDYEEERELWW